MNLTQEQQLYITSSIQKILKTEFGSGPKTFLKNTHDRLNFACPYCGDSTDVHKKRGNIYWKNLSFHCYNSGCSKIHSNLITMLRDFNTPISNKDDLITYLDYMKDNQVIAETKDYIEFGAFKNLLAYSIPIEDIKKKFKLVDVAENEFISSYLKERLLHKHFHRFLYDPNRNQLYIFNFGPDMKSVIGYQIRNFNKNKAKYISYNIEKINSSVYNKIIDLPSEEILKINTLSIYFGILHVNFEKPFTIFEGPIDSFFLKNSIAITGIDKSLDMFLEMSNCRILFDNDTVGIKEMDKILKTRKNVFMWKKLLLDFNIKINIKDFNDLLIYCWKNKNNAIKDVTKYFTNNPLDIRSI